MRLCCLVFGAAVFVAAVWTGSFATGQNTPHALDAAGSAAVDEAVKAEIESQGLVGVAVGVVENGQTIYLGCYGRARIEPNRAVTEETVFNWASNSKPFVAVAAMQLVQAGKLDLDADVREYVPEFPEKEHRVTVRSLMCHQSGIPHYRNGKIVPLATDSSHPPDDNVPAQAIWRFAASPLIFAPGERQEYSSYAYVLLSAVVESAGGESVGEQLRKRMIEPLQLKNFQMDVAVDTDNPGQDQWAVGHTRTSAGDFLAVGDYAHAWKHGAGGYKSDIRDFARWAAALLEPTLLDQATERQMWTRQKLTGGKAGTYGLGFAVEGKGTDLKISHGGSQDETRTHLVVWPNQERGVVVMCNTNHGDARKIAMAVAAAVW